MKIIKEFVCRIKFIFYVLILFNEVCCYIKIIFGENYKKWVFFGIIKR